MITFACILGQVNVCIAQTVEPTVNFNIPSQPLDAALVVFSVQADVNIVGLTATLKQFVTPDVRGTMSRADALEMLLANTGLDYQFGKNQAVSIFVAKLVVEQPIEKPEPKPLLEEVIVSATRRSSNLQKTPIAVTALNQEILARNQVADLRDITHIVPGLEMIDTAPQAAILVQLRGVGTTNITEIADGPVAIHVDGVYSPRSQGAAALLYDIDRVEVLRGPQGTLFGRNSASGSINVYTHQPVLDAMSADVSLSYGNYDHKGLRGALNLPLGDDFSLRIAGASNQHDAYTDLLNSYAGVGPQYPATVAELGDYDQALNLNQKGPEAADQSSWRISALWQPTDKFTAFVSAERYSDSSTGIAELDPTLVEQGIRGVVFDSPSFLDLTNDALRSRIEYRFAGDYSLRYIFGLSEMNRRQIFDADNGRDGGFEQQRTHTSTFNFYSHEIQLLNGDEGQLKWIMGAFSSEEQNEIVFAVDQQNAEGNRSPEGATSWISDDEGAAVSYAVQPDRRAESLGVFAQATYDLNTFSRLTLGTRYTEDTKSDRGGRALNCRVTSLLGPYTEAGSIGPGAPGPDQIYADIASREAIRAGLPHDEGTNEGIGDEPCWVRQVNDFSVTWRNTSGLIRFDVDLLEDVMLYASVSNGFKSGHIQDAGNNAAPETVINYELGIKSQLLSDKMRINAALYLADYDNLQFSNQDRLDNNGDGVADTGGSTVVRNASEATIKGLELELEWALSGADHIQFVGTLMQARFDQFEIPDTLFGNLFNPFVSTESSSPLEPVDLSGNSPPRTPDWKFTFTYEHDFEFAAGILTPRFQATFSDEYFLDIYNRRNLNAGIFANVPDGGTNLGVQDSYHLFDISLRFRAASKKWMAEAYVKNVTDENIKISSGNFITESGFVATYTPPRTVGVRFNYSFGSI